VLRHRNKVLLDARIARREFGDVLEPWNDQLVRLAAPIMVRRMAFVDEFSRFIRSSYHHVVGDGEEPSIAYAPSVALPEAAAQEAVEEILRGELAEQAGAELRTGTSLVGPHRDELVFRLNGLDLRKFASQGQHKTYLVALKIGEFFYLQERCGEAPILLLDDIFSELDEHRSAALLDYVGELSQTFVTSTNPALLEGRSGARDRRWIIDRGRIVHHEALA
jgi:DNA replication and repair protein RecF